MEQVHILVRENPSFTTSDVTGNSISLSTSEDESPSGLAFNIYLSVDGGSSYTKHNSIPIDATSML